MIFFFCFFLVLMGMMITAIPGLTPFTAQYMIPDAFRFLFFMVGFVITFLGLFILFTRAKKTGAEHLLEFGRPGTAIWFYAHRDGTIKITPSVREIGQTLYCKELDAQVNDLKSYKLFDHNIRFVPEGLGHTVDLDMVLYTTLLKDKWGFSNLREARGHRDSKIKIAKETISEEGMSIHPDEDFRDWYDRSKR